MPWLIIIAALTPVILLLVYIFYKDMRQPEPLIWLLKAVGYGVLSGVLVISVLAPVPEIVVTGWLTAALKAFCQAAIPEESAKMLMLWLLLRKNPYYDERLDGIVYATCVSLGFAGLENISYLVSGYMSEGGWVSTAVTRALFAVPGHFFFGVLMGFFYALASFGSRKARARNLILAWCMPVLAHGLYDTVLMGVGTSSNAVAGILMLAFLFAFNGLRKYSVGLIEKHRNEED
jgi:RsiW-degrading membrane proteinase PrsW (M82 family)